MTAKLTTLLTAAALTLSLTAPAVSAQDMGEQVSMLTTSVTNALTREGFDTSNVGSLSLNEIAEIKNILDGGSQMGSTDREKIKTILADG